MAADERWLGLSTDVNDTANYAGGAKPANNDVFALDEAANGPTTNTSGLSAITGLTVKVGPQFDQEIGATGAGLQLGTGATIDFKGLRVPASYWAPQGTGTAINILSTSTGQNAFVHESGTVTNVRVLAGRVWIGASATVTNLYVLGPAAQVTIASGAAVTTIHQMGGRVICNSDFTTLNLHGGIFEHRDTVNGNVTTINMHGSDAVYKMLCESRTISTLNVYRGLVDGSGNPALDTNVITALNVYAGGRAILVGSSASCTGTYTLIGGKVEEDGTMTRNVTLQSGESGGGAV